MDHVASQRWFQGLTKAEPWRPCKTLLLVAALVSTWMCSKGIVHKDPFVNGGNQLIWIVWLGCTCKEPEEDVWKNVDPQMWCLTLTQLTLHFWSITLIHIPTSTTVPIGCIQKAPIGFPTNNRHIYIYLGISYFSLYVINMLSQYSRVESHVHTMPYLWHVTNSKTDIGWHKPSETFWCFPFTNVIFIVCFYDF